MSLIEFAKSELAHIGMGEDASDEMDIAMRDHILKMVETFAAEGHSGFSASLALSLLQKLLDYKPLSPLTGEDSEWLKCGYGNSPVFYQNKRCSTVFKDEDGNAYDIRGLVFYTWELDDEGNAYKSYFTNQNSRTPVEFPYTPRTEYADATPNVS